MQNNIRAILNFPLFVYKIIASNNSILMIPCVFLKHLQLFSLSSYSMNLIGKICENSEAESLACCAFMVKYNRTFVVIRNTSQEKLFCSTNFQHNKILLQKYIRTISEICAIYRRTFEILLLSYSSTIVISLCDSSSISYSK